MSKPITNSAKEEQLVDPWATPSTNTTNTNLKPPSVLPLTSTSPAITQDGRIEYSCLIPAAAGGVMGAAGGAIMNIFGKQPASVGAFAGAVSLVAVSAVNCSLLKANNGSIYDHNYNRAISYSVGASLWPIAGEIYRTMTRQPVLHPRVAFHRALSCAFGGAIFGGVMDYFDWMRPKQEYAIAAQSAIEEKKKVDGQQKVVVVQKN